MDKIFLCLLFVAGALSIPVPQGNSGDPETRTVASTCTEQEVEELVLDLDACDRAANRPLIEALTNGGDVVSGLCQATAAKDLCYKDNLGRCFSESHVLYKRIERLGEMRERALNDPELLGESFLQSCPVMQQYETLYLTNYAGDPNLCSFDLYNQTLEIKKACDKEVSNQLNQRTSFVFLLDSASVPDALANLHCQARNDWDNQCRAILKKCKTPEKFQELIETDEEFYTNKMEKDLQSIIPDFTFASHCGGLSDGTQSDRENFAGEPSLF